MMFARPGACFQRSLVNNDLADEVRSEAEAVKHQSLKSEDGHACI